MATNKILDRNVPDLLVRYHKEVEEAARTAVRDALLRQKREGNPVPVSRDGRVVILQPDEINVDADDQGEK
jgi:hypothetical protein